VQNYSKKEIKKEIRERVLTLLRNQKEEKRLKGSLIVQNELFQLKEFHNCELILFYASFDGEVDTFEMIKQAKSLGKKIGLPSIDKQDNKFIPRYIHRLEEDLQEGKYGISEPKPHEENIIDYKNIDMVIVPGVAFDKENNRLGRGAGYYDHFLKELSADIPKVGLAFDFQVVDSLPYEEHDVRLTHVLHN